MKTKEERKNDVMIGAFHVLMENHLDDGSYDTVDYMNGVLDLASKILHSIDDEVDDNAVTGFTPAPMELHLDIDRKQWDQICGTARVPKGVEDEQ